MRARDEGALEALRECAVRVTGFAPAEHWGRALREVYDAERAAGESPERIAEAARLDEPRVVGALRAALAIGETYFFRHPEQFEFARDRIAERLAASPGRALRAWSAGCATGEEAWSIAAMLLATAPAGTPVEVVGTDMVERRLVHARAGVYDRWSWRAGEPAWVSVFEPRQGTSRRVRDEVRPHVRFERHHLLEGAPPAGPFDLVFCRNVLVYFARPRAAEALATLAASLAPDGLLVCGPMDVVESHPDLSPLGPTALQCYERRRAPLAAPRVELPRAPLPPPSPRPVIPVTPPPAPRTPPRMVPLSSPPPVRPPAPDRRPVEGHLRALALAEDGREAEALRLLEDVAAHAPAYVPGLLERGLLLGRVGRRPEAMGVMRAILAAGRDVPPDDPVPGPEPLPMRFYLEAAESFLERHGER